MKLRLLYEKMFCFWLDSLWGAFEKLTQSWTFLTQQWHFYQSRGNFFNFWILRRHFSFSDPFYKHFVLRKKSELPYLMSYFTLPSSRASIFPSSVFKYKTFYTKEYVQEVAHTTVKLLNIHRDSSLRSLRFQ